MEEICLLGTSLDAVTIIFDIIKETKKTVLFKFFPNTENVIRPDMPILSSDFEIMPFGTKPNNSNKVFFATPGPKNKEIIFNNFHRKHGIDKDRFLKIIHSSAYVANSCNIEEGVLIEPHAVISSQSYIGFGVFIKRGSLIGHHNIIGDYTDINPGVTISGNVTIGKKCLIGSGAVIKDKITIGDNTIIGVGSVVTKNIPANCIAYGNPCKVIKDNLE